MEVEDRLKGAEKKRIKKNKKTASKNLVKTANPGQAYSRNVYNGPVVEKFIAYSTKFDSLLRKIFESAPYEIHVSCFQNRTASFRDKMCQVYSENSHLIKKKPDLPIDPTSQNSKKRPQSLMRPPKLTEPQSRLKNPFTAQLCFPVLSTPKNPNPRAQVSKLKQPYK